MGPPLFSTSSAILRLLGAGGEVRSMEARPRRAAQEPSAVDAGDVQPSPPASFIAAVRDQDAERVDAVAGSEFIDDRMRLQE
jgi:hypothetical protein